jgi:TonB family protein
MLNVHRTTRLSAALVSVLTFGGALPLLQGQTPELGATATLIRVRNGSRQDLKDIVVGDKHYRDIKPGAVTDYQIWTSAYRYAHVSLTAGSSPMAVQPIDYVGESQLGPGHFTYVLEIRDSELRIRAEEDTTAIPPPSYSAAPQDVTPTSTPGADWPEPVTASDFVHLGYRDLRAKNYEAATQNANKALELQPELLAAMRLRAQALYNAKEYQAAIQDYSALIERYPDWGQLYDERGLAYSYSARFDLAIPDYTKAIALDRYMAAAYNNRGWSYLETGDITRALQDLNHAVELSPEYVRAYENRAKAFDKQNDRKNKLADLNFILRISPTNQWARSQRDALLVHMSGTGAAAYRRTESAVAVTQVPGANFQSDATAPEHQSESAASSAQSPGSGDNAGPVYRPGSNGISGPSILTKVEPEYSEEARRAKFQGTVVLMVDVDEHGMPRNLRVIRPLGLGLDEKALEAVSKWRFNPGLKDGRPVATEATVQVEFRLLVRPDPQGVVPVPSNQRPVDRSGLGANVANATNDGPANEKAQKTYREAVQYLQQHQVEPALDSFKKADKQDGGHCLACQKQMIKYGCELGDWKTAEFAAGELAAAATAGREAALAHDQFALVLFYEGQQKRKDEPFSHAHDELTKALAEYASFPEAIFLDGRVLAYLRQDDAARARFEQYVHMKARDDADSQRAQRYIYHVELARARLAPPFAVTTTDGKRISLDDLQGKVVLLDFWATWCGPCIAALPHMHDIARKFQGQPLILSVSLDTNERKWKEFVAQNNMTWPQYRDSGFNGSLAKLFAVTAIPQTFTIGADGVLQDQHIGDASIEGELKKLLAQARELQTTESRTLP